MSGKSNELVEIVFGADGGELPIVTIRQLQAVYTPLENLIRSIARSNDLDPTLVFAASPELGSLRFKFSLVMKGRPQNPPNSKSALKVYLSVATVTSGLIGAIALLISAVSGEQPLPEEPPAGMDEVSIYIARRAIADPQIKAVVADLLRAGRAVEHERVELYLGHAGCVALDGRKPKTGAAFIGSKVVQSVFQQGQLEGAVVTIKTEPGPLIRYEGAEYPSVVAELIGDKADQVRKILVLWASKQEIPTPGTQIRVRGRHIDRSRQRLEMDDGAPTEYGSVTGIYLVDGVMIYD